MSEAAFDRKKAIFAFNWKQLLERMGIESIMTFDNIYDTYNCRGNHYHNFSHIEDCLKLYAILPKEVTDDSLELAIWIHDLHYVAGGLHNEEESVNYFMGSISHGEKLPALQRAMDLVLATKLSSAEIMEKYKPGDLETWIHDIDYCVLGQPSDSFVRYCHDIDHEFRHVPYRTYNAKRIEFFKSVIDFHRIYVNDCIFTIYEMQARTNIMREIARMKEELSPAKLAALATDCSEESTLPVNIEPASEVVEEGREEELPF